MCWKILKCNPGQKSLKAPFAIYLDVESLLKKGQSHQNNNLEESYTEKRPNMSLLVGQCLQNVHLMKKKINLIIVEEKLALKNYLKSWKSVQ